MLKAAENIERRIDWPHFYVKRVVNGDRVGVDYKELRVDEFVLGFTAMLRSPKCNMDVNVMMGILNMLMEDSVDFAWENARAFYQMIGIEVEKGVRKWTDTEYIEKKRLIHSRTNIIEKKEAKDNKKAGPARGYAASVRCCALFQRHGCEHNRDHPPFTHGCTYCHKCTGVVYRHAEEDCYRKANEASKNDKKRE